jgi:hypothetical protein
LNIVEISGGAQQLSFGNDSLVTRGEQFESGGQDRALRIQLFGDRGEALLVTVADDSSRGLGLRHPMFCDGSGLPRRVQPVPQRDRFDRRGIARDHFAGAGGVEVRTRSRNARWSGSIEAVTLWHRLHAAREATAVAERAVTQAEAAARIVRDRYEQGLTTITEQLNAQSAVVTARFELLAARYETVIAKAELLRATGDLDDVQSFL